MDNSDGQQEALGFPSEPTASFESIAPEQAAFLLKLNTRNRLLNERLVTDHVRNILGGDWATNGEAIKLSWPVPRGTGVLSPILLDGQHRLEAIKRAGVAVTTLVVRGLDPDVQTTMDTGRKRSTADALAIDGFKYPQTLSATLNNIWRLDQGLNKLPSNPKPSTRELMHLLNSHPAILRSIEIGEQTYRDFSRFLPAAALATTHHVLGRLDPEGEYAPYFFALIGSGENLERGHPVLALRQRVMAIRRNSTDRLPMRRAIALIVLAWNRCVENQAVKTILAPLDVDIPDALAPMGRHIPMLLEAVQAEKKNHADR